MCLAVEEVEALGGYVHSDAVAHPDPSSRAEPGRAPAGFLIAELVEGIGVSAVHARRGNGKVNQGLSAPRASRTAISVSSLLVVGMVGDDRGVLKVFGAEADDEGLVQVVPQMRAAPPQRGRALRGPGHRGAGGSRRRLPSSVDFVEVHGGGADEGGYEYVVGILVERFGGSGLLKDSVLYHRHPVAHGHGLDLVVGDVESSDPQLSLYAGYVGPHLDSQLGVEVRQRLVHEKQRRTPHNGSTHGHPLALPARQLRRLLFELLGELEDFSSLVDLLIGDPSCRSFGA